MLRTRPFLINCCFHSTNTKHNITPVVINTAKKLLNQYTPYQASRKLNKSLSRYEFQLRYFELIDSFFDNNEIVVKNLLAASYYDLKAIVSFLHLKDTSSSMITFSSSSKIDLIHMITNNNRTINDLTGVVFQKHLNKSCFIRADLGIGLSRSQILELCPLTLKQLKNLCENHMLTLSPIHSSRYELMKLLISNGIYPSKPISMSKTTQAVSNSDKALQPDTSMAQLYKHAKARCIKLEMHPEKEKVIELIELHDKGLLRPNAYKFPTKKLHPQLKSIYIMMKVKKLGILNLCSLSRKQLKEICSDINIRIKRYSTFDLISLIGNARWNNLPKEFTMDTNTKKIIMKRKEYNSDINATIRNKYQTQRLIVNNVDITTKPIYYFQIVAKENNLILPPSEMPSRNNYFELFRKHLEAGQTVKLPNMDAIDDVVVKYISVIDIKTTGNCRSIMSQNNDSKNSEQLTTQEINLSKFSLPHLRRIATENNKSSLGTKIQVLKSLQKLSQSGEIIRIPLFKEDMKIGAYRLSDLTRVQLYDLFRNNNVERDGISSSISSSISRSNSSDGISDNSISDNSISDNSHDTMTTNANSRRSNSDGGSNSYKHFYMLKKVDMALILQAHLAKGGTLDFQCINK